MTAGDPSLYADLEAAWARTEQACQDAQAACDAALACSWWKPITMLELRQAVSARRATMRTARSAMVDAQIAYLDSIRWPA